MVARSDDQLSEAETVKRRDAAILKALKTPPKPHKAVVAKRRKKPMAAKRQAR